MRQEKEPPRLRTRPRLITPLTGFGLFVMVGLAGCGDNPNYVPIVFNPQVSVTNPEDVLAGSQRLLVSCDVSKALKIGNDRKPLGLPEIVVETPREALIFLEEDRQGPNPVNYPYRVRTEELRDTVVETSISLNGNKLNSVQKVTYDNGSRETVLAEGKASVLQKDKSNDLTCKAKTQKGKTYQTTLRYSIPNP